MNAGQRTLVWLYREQLQIDNQWAVRTANGFRWWADQQAQTIEILREERGPEGLTGYLISVRTDLVRGVEPGSPRLGLLNGHVLSEASMSGPVYDGETGTLTLCSLVRVHDGNQEWLAPLLSLAATLQVGEARILGPLLAGLLGAEEARSPHPLGGLRTVPDEMAEIIPRLVVPMGQGESRWSHGEFRKTFAEHIKVPPALRATEGDLHCRVEFPFGRRSSLCRLFGNQPHPRYGSGLLILQTFPVEEPDEAAGTQLALRMNRAELLGGPFGYGLGSYAFRDGGLHFNCFIPNAAYRPGILTNMYLGCAQRAGEVSRLLLDEEREVSAPGPRRDEGGPPAFEGIARVLDGLAEQAESLVRTGPVTVKGMAHGDARRLRLAAAAIREPGKGQEDVAAELRGLHLIGLGPREQVARLAQRLSAPALEPHGPPASPAPEGGEVRRGLRAHAVTALKGGLIAGGAFLLFGLPRAHRYGGPGGVVMVSMVFGGFAFAVGLVGLMLGLQNPREVERRWRAGEVEKRAVSRNALGWGFLVMVGLVGLLILDMMDWGL